MFRGSLADALFSQVKPRFSLPATAMALFGGLLVTRPDPWVLGGHAFTVGLAVYAAHLRDSYVDFYGRGEDESLRLTEREVRVASWFVSGCALAVTLVLGTIDPVGGVLTAVLVVLAWVHAPFLDTNPITKTVDYPVGIGCAILGGYRLQAHEFVPEVVAVAAVYVVLLAGLVVRIDLLDYEADQKMTKRTVPVVLGLDRARTTAVGLVLLAMLLVLAFVVISMFPAVAALGVVFPVVALVLGRSRSDTAAFRLYMLSVYPFTLVLFIALRWGV